VADELTKDAVGERLTRALDRLLREDLFLLQSDVNERSISHKLAEYLQLEFSGWHVDCEYNRQGHDPKRLDLKVHWTSTDDPQARTVYPDIIVHHRNSDENLLVIEIKKSTNPDRGDFDREKLAAFISQLGYRYGAFIVIGTNTESPYWEIEFQ
jgi:hypothetical protein